MSSETHDVESFNINGEYVSISKEYEGDEYPVPAIVYKIENNHGNPVLVQIKDVLEGIDEEDIGFHPQYGAKWWAQDENVLKLTKVIEGGSTYETLYGVRSTDDLSNLDNPPQIEIETTTIETEQSSDYPLDPSKYEGSPDQSNGQNLRDDSKSSSKTTDEDSVAPAGFTVDSSDPVEYEEDNDFSGTDSSGTNTETEDNIEEVKLRDLEEDKEDVDVEGDEEQSERDQEAEESDVGESDDLTDDDDEEPSERDEEADESDDSGGDDLADDDDEESSERDKEADKSDDGEGDDLTDDDDEDPSERDQEADESDDGEGDGLTDDDEEPSERDEEADESDDSEGDDLTDDETTGEDEGLEGGTSGELSNGSVLLARVEQLESDISELRAYTGALEDFLEEEGTSEEIQEMINQMNETITDHEERLIKLHERVDEIDETVAVLESEEISVSTIQDIQSRLEELETWKKMLQQTMTSVDT